MTGPDRRENKTGRAAANQPAEGDEKDHRQGQRARKRTVAEQRLQTARHCHPGVVGGVGRAHLHRVPAHHRSGAMVLVLGLWRRSGRGEPAHHLPVTNRARQPVEQDEGVQHPGNGRATGSEEIHGG